MAYKYYEEKIDDEHYLYADEVAQYLYGLGITTLNGKPPVRMVQAILDDFDKYYAAREGKTSYKLYYNTRNGLKRVYRSGQYIISVAQDIFADIECGEQVLEINNKHYRYKIHEKDESGDISV